jgi:hypothetical protein
MKKQVFYMIMNSLYKMNYRQYTNYIKKKILNTSWFKEAVRNKKIKIIYLEKNSSNKYLNIQFIIKDFISYKRAALLNVNLKNITIYNIRTLLKEVQHKFIKTNNSLDLKLITRVELVKIYKKRFNIDNKPRYLDLSLLSKILSHYTFNMKKKNYYLVSLLPSKTYLISIYIRDIISKNPIISDSQISNELEKNFQINCTRRQVCYIRIKYLIATYLKRDKISYKYNEKYFTQIYHLTKAIISKIVPNSSGIYELIANNQTVYIGSSKNLKSRLYNYSVQNGHTDTINSFMQKNLMYIRFIKTAMYKKYEKIFLDDFIYFTGKLPILNKQRVLNV